MSQSLPKQAAAVVIGGGIAGVNLLYQLAAMGWRDVVLLERRELSCGTTWHAAGLMSSFRTTAAHAHLVNYTRTLYQELEAQTGQGTGYKEVGSLSIAADLERAEEYRRSAEAATALGCAAHYISPEEVGERYPLLNAEDLIGGLWIPGDGQISPVDVVQCVSKAAQSLGAQIFSHTEVLRVERKNNRVCGVETSAGYIATNVVINCGGMWARHLADQVGVTLPLHACEHFYVVTDKIADLPNNLPVMREHSASAYFKEDAGSLLIGAFEPKAKPWGMTGIPKDFCFDELPEDWDHFMPVLESAMHRVPLLENVGIRKFFNGPESFTPDDQFYYGPAPELPGYWVLAGFNSVGIQTAGGAANILAQWIVNGKPRFEVLANDIRRAQPFQRNPEYLKERVSETLGLLYAHHYPYRQVSTARGLRRSPFHAQLVAANAGFGEVNGWERPNFFAPQNTSPEYQYSFGRQNWFDWSAQEHRAIREDLGILDLSSFGKLLVQGRDALAVLNYVCANQIDQPIGRVIYTQMLNEHGGIEADITIQRWANDQFYVVTPAATLGRERDWISRAIAPEQHCSVTDITAGYAVLALMGPRSRQMLEALTSAEVSDAALPFGHSCLLDIGYAQVRAARLSYVGALGYELHISTDQASYVAEQLLAQASPPRWVGLHAMDSLRQEKGYRHFGHDIGEVDTPLEAGLGFALCWDKGDFIGRAAVLAQKEAGPLTKRMLHFCLQDPEPLLYHGEPVYRNAEAVGYLSSASYGHSLGAAVGMGYIHADVKMDAAWVDAGQFSILVNGQMVEAKASISPFYDPKSLQMRG